MTIAHESGDSATERHARLHAARWIAESLRLRGRGGRTVDLARIERHLSEAQALGATPLEMAVERALAGRLEDDPTPALEWARTAVGLSSDPRSEALRVDALVVFLQLCTNLGLFDEGMSVSDDALRQLDGSSGESSLVLAASWFRLRSATGDVTRVTLTN